MDQRAGHSGAGDLFCLQKVSELFKSGILSKEMIDPVREFFADIGISGKRLSGCDQLQMKRQIQISGCEIPVCGQFPVQDLIRFIRNLIFDVDAFRQGSAYAGCGGESGF